MWENGFARNVRKWFWVFQKNMAIPKKKKDWNFHRQLIEVQLYFVLRNSMNLCAIPCGGKAIISVNQEWLDFLNFSMKFHWKWKPSSNAQHSVLVASVLLLKARAKAQMVATSPAVEASVWLIMAWVSMLAATSPFWARWRTWSSASMPMVWVHPLLHPPPVQFSGDAHRHRHWPATPLEATERILWDLWSTQQKEKKRIWLIWI